MDLTHREQGDANLINARIIIFLKLDTKVLDAMNGFRLSFGFTYYLKIYSKQVKIRE